MDTIKDMFGQPLAIGDTVLYIYIMGSKARATLSEVKLFTAAGRVKLVGGGAVMPHKCYKISREPSECPVCGEVF